jgi:hypothetical protein
MKSFKSEAHRRRFIVLLDEGVIDQKTFDAMEKATDRSKLLPRSPDRPKSMKPRMAKVIR